MSYILDALKKSEQDRGHGSIPDVQTVHSSSLNYRSEKKTYWPFILIVAVLLNLFAIIYFIVSKENPAEIETTVQKTSVTDHTNTENNVASDEAEKAVISTTEINMDNINTETIQTPVDEAAATATDKTIQRTEKSKTTSADTGRQPISNKTNIIEFYDLPDSIKQELPSFIISAHVYSTNPAQRSIVINNNFMEEGEYILDGLILYEITPDGAIFNYQGTLFNYGVVSGWQ